MATVVSKTSIKIDDLINDTVVSGYVEDGMLILVNRAGAEIFAGDVMTGSPIAAWPVGSIFLSVVPTNPATLLGGGTWVAIGTGRTLIGVDPVDSDYNSVEETGGSKTVTLVKANVPTHIHTINHDHPDVNKTINYVTNSTAGGGSSVRVSDVGNVTGGGGSGASMTIGTPTRSDTSGTGSPDGLGSTPVANVPPYLTCYMWKRTA